jgi:predicted RNase H-like nuclease (RuvC/YqgF family)
VPRKPSKEHPELPFDAPATRPDGAGEETVADPMPTAKKVGRPRKWESEAERKRAYRERLAADLAEPERLRRELRNAKRQGAEKARRLSEMERDLARAEAEIERRRTRESELQSTIERLERRVDDWRSRANALARSLEAERAMAPVASSSPVSSVTPPTLPKPPPKRVSKAKAKRRKRR